MSKNEYNSFKDLPKISGGLNLDKFFKKEYEVKLIEPGVYDAVVKEVRMKTAKTGRPYISIMFSVSTDSGTVPVWRNYFPYEVDGSVSEMGLNILGLTLRGLGFNRELLEKFELCKHIPALYELTCKVNTGREEYNDKEKNTIVSVRVSKKITDEDIEYLKSRMEEAEKESIFNKDSVF